MNNKDKIKVREGLTGLIMGAILMFLLGIVDVIEQYHDDPHQRITISNK